MMSTVATIDPEQREMSRLVAQKNWNAIAERAKLLAANEDVPRTPDADPLTILREAGAIVGYDALVEATAVPPVPIWYEGIEADSHIEVSGPSGHGKTTLAILLAVARANTGRPIELLGRRVVPGDPGSFVVVVEEENGKFSLRKKVEIACEALGLPIRETIDRLIFLVRRGVVGGDQRWAAVEALGRAGRVAMVLVDSRARVLRRGESNKEEDQSAVANMLHGLVEACRAPVVVISHTRKGERGGGPEEIEDISGSSQRGAGADVVLLVTAKKDIAGRVESSRVKFAKLREVVDEHPEPVAFRLARDVDGRWCIEASAVDTVDHDPRPLADRLRELLAEHPAGLLKTQIREALKASSQNIEAAISDLFAAHALTKEQSLGKNGKPTHRFVLKGDGR